MCHWRSARSAPRERGETARAPREKRFFSGTRSASSGPPSRGPATNRGPRGGSSRIYIRSRSSVTRACRCARAQPAAGIQFAAAEANAQRRLRMRIAATLERYLDEAGIDYELVEHPQSVTSREAADAAGVDEDRVAKAVVLEDRKHFLAVMIPASRRVHFTTLHEHLGRHVGLATEDEVRLLFDDCVPGAVPGTPQAYGIDVLVDDAL